MDAKEKIKKVYETMEKEAKYLDETHDEFKKEQNRKIWLAVGLMLFVILLVALYKILGV